MNPTIEENIAFIAGLKYFSRILCRLLEAQSPQYKYSIEWGPTVSEGLSVISAPPAGANEAFYKLSSFIKLFRPSNKVRVVADTNIVTVPSKTFPLYLPEPASPGNPPIDNVPNPYDPPVYCWPCEDKVYTA